MKPASFRICALLVIACLAIPWQATAASLDSTKHASLPQALDLASAITVSLSGWFNILWGDTQDMQGDGEPIYLLQDELGKTTYLDLSQSGIPFDRLLRLNGKQVQVAGFSPGDKGVSPVQVHEIIPSEDLPQPLPPVLGNQKYVSILCKFSDVAVEPKNLAFFQGMYANTFPGLDHYWQEVSYNQVNLAGSQAHGWFNLLQPRSYYIYDMNSDGDLDADFARLTADCTTAADSSVNYTEFDGINMMFNADLDGPSYGGGYLISLDSPTPQLYATTWIASWGYADISVVEHEMGHSFGLPHSSGMYGLVYDNWWDVMSWDRHSGLPDATYGRTGQHTISYHKDLLGWLSPADKFTAPQDGLVHTVTLERLALPQTANPKMAIVPVKNSTRFYTVETREGHDAGYDRNLYGINVIIHEVDPAREIPAQVVDYDNNGQTNDDGAVWVTWPGKQETFIDATDGISVTVVGVEDTNYTVDIKISDPFPFPGCGLQNQMPQSSCEALTALYDDTGGASWTNHAHWLGPEWPCRWFGVSCKNEFGDVEILYLENNHLAGTIPAELGNLTQIWNLDLGANALTGSIPPALDSLDKVYALDLSINQLTGSIPAEMGLMSSLAELHLEHNQLSGNLPASLGNLSNLISINLSHNQLSGSLPPQYSSLTKLAQIYLDHNQLSGAIPAYLGNFTNLFSLNLSDNAFSGPLPAELGNLVNLWEITVNNNQLSGSIPAALGGMANLHYAYFYHNQLSGPIPESLVAIPTLAGLALNENALSGAIPLSLGNNPSINYLHLANNMLDGEIPSNLASLPSLYQLDLGYNMLSASDPALITFLNVKDPDWAQTQTVRPQNFQAIQQGADVLLSWTPILYTGNGGYYEISAAPSLAGPYSVIGNTPDKTAANFLASGLGAGSYFFHLRTYTPAHGYQQSALWSQYTQSVGYQAWAVYLPIAQK